MKKVLLISLLILIVASIFVVYKFVLLRDATEIEFIPTDSPQFHLSDGARARIGRGRLNKMAISPDNSVLAVASGIGIWLYDLQSGEALKLLMPHTSNVSAIAFSPNSNILASGSTDNIVRLWDIDSGELLHTFIGHIDGIFDIVFSPDGKMLASASIHAINVWDMSTRTHKQRYKWPTYSIRSRIAFNDDEPFVAEVNHSEPQTKKIVLTYPVSNFTEPHKKTLEAPKHPVRDVSLSPDGEFLLSEGYRNSFLLWEVDTGKQRKIINGDTDDVLGVFFSADGKSLVSVDKNRDLHIWDIATEKKKKTIKGNFNSRHNAEIIYNGGSIVNKKKNGTIRLFNIDNDLREITITGHPIWTFDVSFNPNGSVAATHNGWGSKNIHLWDLSTGKYSSTLFGHKKVVYSMAFSPDGKTLASGSQDKTIILWDLSSRKLKKKIRGNRHAISKVVFSPDGNTLAAVDGKKGLYLWNVFTGALKMDFNNSSTHISEILFSLDGQSLLSWDYQGSFTAWDVSTGKHKTVNTNHTSVFSQKLFSPDGKSFAVATREFTKEHRMIYQLELWDAVVGNLKHRLIGHTDQVLSFCFSPTGRTLASGSEDKTIRLWDVDTGEQIHLLTDPLWKKHNHIDNSYDVKYVSFSQDGRTLASGIRSGDIYLWDTETGEQKQILSGHTLWIDKMIFSEDGQPIASNGVDGTVLLWENGSVSKE